MDVPLEFAIRDMRLPAGLDGFIGCNFFVRHVVCIDYPDKQALIGR